VKAGGEFLESIREECRLFLLQEWEGRSATEKVTYKKRSRKRPEGGGLRKDGGLIQMPSNWEILRVPGEKVGMGISSGESRRGGKAIDDLKHFCREKTVSSKELGIYNLSLGESERKILYLSTNLKDRKEFQGKRRKSGAETRIGIKQKERERVSR